DQQRRRSRDFAHTTALQDQPADDSADADHQAGKSREIQLHRNFLALCALSRHSSPDVDYSSFLICLAHWQDRSKTARRNSMTRAITSSAVSLTRTFCPVVSVMTVSGVTSMCSIRSELSTRGS